MITKILFTAFVIVVVFAITRFRVQRLKIIPAPAPVPVASRRPATHRNIAYGVIAAIAVVAAVLYYLRWSDWHEVVMIRVVNSRTGEAVTYEAYKGDIEEHSFKTLDGWKVKVSESERVEIKHAGR